MIDKTLTEHLEFVVAQRGEDEATILARALRSGLAVLYRETLIESYLLGRIDRDTALRTLGPEQLEEVEQRREALRRDVEWGLKRA